MSLDYPPQVRRPAFRRAYRLPFRSPAGIETVIANALADINADDLVGIASVSEIPNSGLGGTGFDYDAAIGTPANGKPHPSGSAVLFGVNGDFLVTADSAANSVFTNGIDIRFEGALADWTPSANNGFANKRDGGLDRSYVFKCQIDGTFRAQTSVDGAGGTEVQYVSTAAPGFANGANRRTRFALVFNNGAGGKTATFWIDPADPDNPDITLLDGSTWDQLGVPITTAGTTSIFDGTALLRLGSGTGGTSENLDGTIRRVQIFNGVDGTLVVDYNAADLASAADRTQTSSATGEAWEYNKDAYAQNTGHKQLTSIGSYGLETTAGQDIAVFTRVIVGRFLDETPGADQVIFDARSNALKSVSLFSDHSNSNKLTLDAGGTPIAIAGAYDNDLHVFTVISNGANSLLRVSGVGEITGNPGSEVLDYGTILANLSTGNSAPFSYSRDITFNAAISGAKIAQIEDALAQKYKGVQV